MTTGSIIQDHRSLISTDCGSGLAGTYYSRIWAGDDDPLKTKINGYGTSIVSENDPVMTWTNQDNPGVTKQGTYKLCFGGVVVDDVVFGDNDEITLINRLGDQIRQHDFDAANSIGAEGKDALKQIAGTASSLYRADKALSRGDLPTAAAELGIPNPFNKGKKRLSDRQKQNNKLGKNLSNSVLAVQLGALPLMDDMASAFNALVSMLNRDMRRTYVSKVKVKGNVYPATAETGKNVCGFVHDSKRLVWTLSAQPTGYEQLSTSNPWDLADLMWNFTALSFVADWIVPIQKFLSAKSTAYDFKGSGYVTRKRIVEAATSYVPPGFSTTGSYGLRTVVFERTLLSSLTVPMPNFKPVESIPSWQRALTAVSLLGQRVLK